MKVALIQQKFHGTKSKTLKKTEAFIKKAALKGADLVLLQELHQNHYFCISEDNKYFDLANDFEKDIIFWGKVAKKYGVVLVTSLFEKRAIGLYHNTAVVFESDGKVAGKYRKMHIPDDPGFYEKYYFTPGDLGYKPIKTSVGSLGVLVCWDQWYPEAARLMALSGADMLIYPTAIGWMDDDKKSDKQKYLEAWMTMQRSHAIANGLPVFAINRIGFEKDETKLLKGIKFWGNSFACDSLGSLLHVSSQDKEEVAIVEIDMKKSEQTRRTWPFLRDRRIETYGNLTKRFLD